jgi:fatty acid desaturase
MKQIDNQERYRERSRLEQTEFKSVQMNKAFLWYTVLMRAVPVHILERESFLFLNSVTELHTIVVANNSTKQIIIQFLNNMYYSTAGCKVSILPPPLVLKQKLCCGCIQFCLICWCRYFDWQKCVTPFRNRDSCGNADRHESYHWNKTQKYLHQTTFKFL